MEQVIAFGLGVGLVVFIIIAMSVFRTNKTINSHGAKIEELYDLIENFEGVLEELTNTLDGRIDEVEETFDEQIESLEKIIDSTEESINLQIESLERSLEGLDRRIDSRADRIISEFDAKFNDSSSFVDGLYHSIKELTKNKK